jgi:hypothetical protein
LGQKLESFVNPTFLQISPQLNPNSISPFEEDFWDSVTNFSLILELPLDLFNAQPSLKTKNQEKLLSSFFIKDQNHPNP